MCEGRRCGICDGRRLSSACQPSDSALLSRRARRHAASNGQSQRFRNRRKVAPRNVDAESFFSERHAQRRNRRWPKWASTKRCAPSSGTPAQTRSDSRRRAASRARSRDLGADRRQSAALAHHRGEGSREERQRLGEWYAERWRAFSKIYRAATQCRHARGCAQADGAHPRGGRLSRRSISANLRSSRFSASIRPRWRSPMRSRIVLQ